MEVVAEPVRDVEFADYVAARRPALLRAAHAISRDPDSAEDLLQTVLTSVFVHWHEIRDYRAADAYVRRAMANQHASWFRQKWRTVEWPTDELPEPPAHWQDEPATLAERQQVWPLVRSLPPRQRSAVVLRYYEELTELETAQVLRCSVGTVKSSTSRGLARLRRLAHADDETPLAG